MRTTTIGRWAPVLALGLLLTLLVAPGASAGPYGKRATADEVTQLVTVSVSGEDKRRLEDTVVTMYRRVDGAWTQEYAAETDRDGRVQFFVPAGTYRVLFEPASADYEARFFGGAVSFDDAELVEVGPEGRSTFNVTLPPSTWIEGRLVDATGAPVSTGYVVVVEKLYPDGWFSVGERYTLDDGGYRAGVYGPGYYRVRTQVFGQLQAVTYSDTVEVDHRGQQVTGVNLRVPVGGSIAGVVRRADGAPFDSANVELVRLVEGQTVTGAFGAGTSTDAEGRYRFDGLPAGIYRVIASDGLNNFTSAIWPDAARLEDGRDIVVTPGQTTRLTAIELRRLPLSRAAAADPPTITGTPVVGSELRADPGYWGLPVNGETLRFGYQWFADGRLIPGATSRHYRPTRADVGKPLVVMVTGSGPWVQPGIAFSDPTVPVRRRPARPASRAVAAAPLPPSAAGFGSGRISGSLEDSQGLPVTGALVEAFREEGRYGVPEAVSTVPTDALGRYELVGLPPGAYQVRFHSAGSQTAFPTMSAPEGGTVVVDEEHNSHVVDARLAPVSSIQGTVTLPSGAPAPYALVQYMRTGVAGGGFWREHRTDAEGRYTILVEPGTYRVQFSRPYYDIAPVHWPSVYSAGAGEDVVVGGGQAVTGIDARLVRGARIQGTVRSERTLDPAHVEIAIYQHTPGGWQEVRFQSSKFLPDRFGSFDLAGLPPGTYRIGFDPFGDGYVPEFWPDSPTVEGGRDIVLEAGEVITGKDVLLADRRPDYPIRVINKTKPRIKGTARVGRTLRVSKGGWLPAAVQLRYQWLAGGKPIPGADGRTLRVRRSMVGDRLRVKVVASTKYWQREAVRTKPTGPVRR